MPQLKFVVSLVLFSSLLFATSGCDRTYVADEGTSKSQNADTELADSNSPTQTTSVSPNKPTNIVSPATTAGLVGKDSTPDGVCRKFMNLLKSGQRLEAENLLTRTALTVTSKAGLQLEPMGGPSSIYKVNDVRYATTKQKLAQVECSIMDEVDGESYKMDVTWLVRKQGNGWRISGVSLEIVPGSPKDLLSFENIRDVTKLKQLADSDAIDDDARQAKASDSTLK